MTASAGTARALTVRSTFGAVRLIVAIVCAVALVARFVWGLGSVTFTATNFFAYLTIQSNIAFVGVAVASGVVALRFPRDPDWLTNLRAAVLACTVVAGIVFAALIQQAGERGFRIDVPWSDQVLHFWLPAAAIVDWVVAPGRGRALWRTVPVVLAYPIIWGVVTLVRGASVGWYPYFFLDPAQVHGFGEFALFSGLALTLFALITANIIAISRMPPLAGRQRR